MSRRLLVTGTVFGLLWAATWIAMTRHAMLDDSLIHLRYAANLVRFHAVTFDGVQRTFGTSSPLYLLLLAGVYSLWPSVFVPKVVSVAIYAILLGVLARRLLLQRTLSLPVGLLLLLFLSLASVMGVRWLADGMETGLVCLTTLCFALFVRHSAGRPSRSGTALCWTLMGFCITLLRVELLLLCATCAALLFLSHMAHERRRVQPALVAALPVLLGGVLAMLTIRAIFGNFLPDTAVAKAGGPFSFGLALLFPKLLASSVLLGLGSTAVWIASLAIALRRAGSRRLEVLTANGIFPLLILLSCARGQAIQGVRYFIWAILFSTVWNILHLEAGDASRVIRRFAGSDRVVFAALLILIVLLVPLDVRYGLKTMQGRSHTFEVMRGDDLSRLRGQTLFADDIGFISYFTQANVCDLNGLVNGRSFAKLTQDQRIRACLDRAPVAMFLTTERVHRMRDYLPAFETDWVACQRIDFPNVMTMDIHYLLVRRRLAKQLCPAAMWVPMDRLSTLSPG